MRIDDCGRGSYSSAVIDASRATAGGHLISRSLIVAALLGFLAVIVLIVESGAQEVARAMLVIGWGLLPITLFHLVPMSFSTLCWRELLPLSSRPNFGRLAWMRWIRESINSLLPVAGVGGDIVGARLAHQQGVPGAEAAASIVVDTTVGVMTQMVFVIAGVTLLVTRSSDGGAGRVALALLIGVAVFAVAIATFVRLQHRSLFATFSNLVSRVTPEKWLTGLAGGASAVDDAVVATSHGELWVKGDFIPACVKLRGQFRYPRSEPNCMTRPVSEHDQPHIRSPLEAAAPTSRLRRAGAQGTKPFYQSAYWAMVAIGSSPGSARTDQVLEDLNIW
ncbi:MAG: lysylphosphatidylglycerol synthase domain-containing protein [Roseiarcus sp.]